MNEFTNKYAFLIKILQNIIHSKLFPRERLELIEEDRNVVDCNNSEIELKSGNSIIDGAKIDLYKITPKDQNGERVIIEFMPMSNTVHGRLDETALMAYGLNSSVYTFNYPQDVKTVADIIDSAISVVNYLLYEERVPPEKIVLSGYCYGAVVAQNVKEHFSKQGLELPLISNNPFISYTSAAAGIIEQYNYNVIIPFSNAIFKLCSWDVGSKEDETALFLYRRNDKILGRANVENYINAIPLTLSIPIERIPEEQREVHFIRHKYFQAEEGNIYDVIKEYLFQIERKDLILPPYEAVSKPFDRRHLPVLTNKDINTLKVLFTVLDILLYGFAMLVSTLAAVAVCNKILLPKFMVPNWDLINKYCVTNFDIELKITQAYSAITITTVVLSGILASVLVMLVGDALNRQAIAEF